MNGHEPFGRDAYFSSMGLTTRTCGQNCMNETDMALARDLSWSDF